MDKRPSGFPAKESVRGMQRVRANQEDVISCPNPRRQTSPSHRKRLSLQIGHGDDLDILDRIKNVLRVGCWLSDAFLKVEHLFGEFDGIQTGGTQQLSGIFQEHLVRVDSLYPAIKSEIPRTGQNKKENAKSAMW